MTTEERLLILGIVAVALIGLAAREWHHRRLADRPYAAPGIEQEQSR